MVVADLHVHTTNSDGTLTLETVPGAARAANVEAVAITDHDRIHPELADPVTVRDGVEIIHGIELRVATEGQRVDLLGYGVHRTDRLESLVEHLQTNRIERAGVIVDCVEDRLDVSLSVPLEPGVGRPHIARAIADSDAPYDYEGAFRDLIGDGCPCFVARDIPTFEEGRQVLSEACALVGLAHPLRYDDPEGAIALATDLDAMERHYPYSGDVDHALVESAFENGALLATGGSDAHDETLGRAGLGRAEYGRIRNHLP